MTVAELITELQKYPPNAVVLQESRLGTFYMGIPSPCTANRTAVQESNGEYIRLTDVSEMHTHKLVEVVVIRGDLQY